MEICIEIFVTILLITKENNHSTFRIKIIHVKHKIFILIQRSELKFLRIKMSHSA